VNNGSGQKQALPLVKLLILAAAIAGLVALMLRFPFEDIQHWGWDIAVFRAGSKAFLHGQNPYDPASVMRFSDGAELASIPNFVYAPIFAILISPLSLLEPWLASRAWFVINLIACTAAVAAIMGALRWTPTPRVFVLIVLGLAAFPPFRTLLVIGQSGGIMLLLLALTFLSLSRGRQASAGIALGLALFKPHLILIPIFLALRRQWKAVLAFLVTSFVISVPFWNLLDDWAISLISTRADNLGYGCLAFSSLAALLRCFAEDSLIQALFTMILILVGYWFVREDASPQSSIFALQLGLVVSLSLLVIDNVRVADLILLVFPFIVAVSQLSDVMSTQLRRGTIALLVAAYLFPYLAQIFGWVTTRPILFGMPIWYASMPTALFAATALLLVDRRRNTKA
jgi:hypothetical protein